METQGAAGPVVPTPPATPPTQADAPPSPARGFNRLELAIVALSIVAGAIVTVGLLMVRGAAPEAAVVQSPQPSSASPVPHLAGSPQPLLAPRWSVANRSRWVTNPKRHVALELAAENKVQAWMKVVEPVLVVRCMNRRVEAFVYTDTPARIERQDEDHTVGLAFDGEAQSAERWPDSADHDALFAPDGAAFTRRLMSARTLRFGFTPHNAAPVTVHFNVAGLSELLKPSARQCGWK